MVLAKQSCAIALLTLACGSEGSGAAETSGDAGPTGMTSTGMGSGAQGTSVVNTSGSSASTTGMPAATSDGDAGSTGTVGASVSSTSSVSSGGTGGTSSSGAGGDTNQAASTGGNPAETGTPTHEESTALLSVRQEHGAAALNGEIYVLGGFTPEVTTSVQAYSPESNSWRAVADFPAEFHHPNVAVVNGILYVAGFHVGSGLRDADGRVFAYDPNENAWTPRTPMPAGTERGTACVATLGTKIYLFGGASDQTLPDASAYDTELDSWEELPLMPELREHCLAAGFDGKIHIVSGRSGSIQGLEVESWMYDPESRSYEERAPIPTPRGGAAGALLGGRIYVFGGEGNAETPETGIFSQVEAYDPVANSWEELPDMLIPRHGYAGAALGDRIYLPGGATNQGFGPVADHTVFYFQAD